ncbi:MAG TPA: DUF1573 domain-containing protein [Saprospiraceae bacterium]|nr:DUF1573 domain-containing protein [Saprospiraceae bacterium]HMQ81815.1 DUF1573 domain-containing protein [Saprospiraceae bacterium]
MKINRILFQSLAMALVIAVIFACEGSDQPQAQSEKTLEEIKSEGAIKNSDIIRNPVSASAPTDTVNVAKMSFEESEYDFGEVDEGAVVNHTFKFVNSGKVPLIISAARSTCGCTVPEWPKDPIPPGESGEIKVKFDSTNKANAQTKPITITANTYPSETKVMLKGFVRSKE